MKAERKKAAAALSISDTKTRPSPAAATQKESFHRQLFEHLAKGKAADWTKIESLLLQSSEPAGWTSDQVLAFTGTTTLSAIYYAVSYGAPPGVVE